MADPLAKTRGEGTAMRQRRHGTDDVWSDTIMNGRRLKWRELFELERNARLEAERWRSIVADLHRNPTGRHEGDVDGNDPTGVSQGNPRFAAGDIVGWNISGRPYIYPPAAERYRFESWLAMQI